MSEVTHVAKKEKHLDDKEEHKPMATYIIAWGKFGEWENLLF